MDLPGPLGKNRLKQSKHTNMKTLLKSLVIGMAGLFLLVSCGGKKSGKESLVGAGATFPLPYYNLAFDNYKQAHGVSVNYGAQGSGAGLRSLADQLVDFAGSDAFMSNEEMAAIPAVIHVPTCLGAAVLAYNLPGVDSLRLTAQLLNDIYLGKLTRWADPAIAAVNPGVTLPDIPVYPVYRSDGSGTTYVFSHYMEAVSAEWAETVGSGKSLKWPVGMAAKGNPGVAGVIKQTEGAIGYMGSEYAFSSKIPMALLQNAAGNFVLPGTESISAAASGNIPDDTRVMITNSEVAGAYPISCLTWMVVYREQAYKDRTIEQARALQDFLAWMVSDTAQSMTVKVHYAPLSEDMAAKAQAQIASMTYNGQPLR